MKDGAQILMKLSKESDEATGTGITGGDPMLDFEKTVLAIKELKKHLEMTTTYTVAHPYRLSLNRREARRIRA